MYDLLNVVKTVLKPNVVKITEKKFLQIIKKWKRLSVTQPLTYTIFTHKIRTRLNLLDTNIMIPKVNYVFMLKIAWVCLSYKMGQKSYIFKRNEYNKNKNNFMYIIIMMLLFNYVW